MSPAAWTFIFGFVTLLIFAWYFFTDSDRVKRILGTVLTVGITAFSVWAFLPPNDVLGPDGQIPTTLPPEQTTAPPPTTTTSVPPTTTTTLVAPDTTIGDPTATTPTSAPAGRR